MISHTSKFQFTNSPFYVTAINNHSQRRETYRRTCHRQDINLSLESFPYSRLFRPGKWRIEKLGRVEGIGRNAREVAQDARVRTTPEETIVVAGQRGLVAARVELYN